MSIIDRYIFKTAFLFIGGVAVVLLGLDVLFALVAELEDVQNEYQMPQAITYVLMTAPHRFYTNIPIYVLVGTLMGLGSLASNSELVVMRAAGLSVSQIILITMKPILLFLTLGLILGQFVVPISEQAAQSHRALMQGGGSFLKIKQGNWHREGNDFLHVNAIEPNGVMHGVTRYKFNEQFEMISTSFARRVIYQGDHWFVEDKRVTRFDEGQVVAETIAASRLDSSLTPKLLTMVVLKPEHLSFTELYVHSNYLKQQGLSYRSYQLELWKKAFQPFVTIVMVLLASSFIFGPLRSVTVGQRVMVGLVMGIVFVQLQEFCGYGSLVFNISPIIAALAPLLLFLCLALYLLRRNQ